MIIFNNVTKKYGDNVGLIDASVHIKSGDFVFLVGPSGAGKTTFIRLILKEIDPDGGRIILAGKDITKIKGGRSRGSGRRSAWYSRTSDFWKRRRSMRM